MNRKKTLTTLLLVISVLMITGFSYAYIGGALSNANKQTASITTGTMTLVFADGTSTLAAKEINIGESITKTFTVENTGTLEATASMYFKDLVNTYMTNSMSYRLEYATSESGTYNVLKEETNVPRSSTAAEELLYGEITVPAGTKYYYKLIITFNNLPEIDQTPDLDAVLNTKFTLKAGHSTAYWLALEGYPLTLPSSMGLNLKDYKIYGNSVQNGTPTPNAPVEVESVGDKTKNLFDKNNANLFNGYFSSNGDRKITNYSQTLGTYGSFYIKCKANTTYTISRKIIGSRFAVGSTGQTIANGTVLNVARDDDNAASITITTTANDDKLVVWFRNAGLSPDTTYTIEEMIDGIQIEEGPTKTEYEPYGYKIPVKVSNDNEDITTNIYLDEPLRKIGDYVDYIDFDNMKVVRNIGKKIFDGSESWVTTGDELAGVYKGFAVRSSDYNVKEGQFVCLSNKFPYSATNVANTIRIQNGTYGLRIIAGIDKVPNFTVAEFKDWLSKNNVTITFPLTTPAEETIDLPNISTLEGATTIELDTEVIPSNMRILYKSS